MTYIIGISGGSASGKTTLIDKIRQNYDSEVISVLSQDNYYKPIHQQRKNLLGEINFDEPESLNLEKYQQDITTLLNGETLTIEEYTFNNSNNTVKKITIEPRQILILEGLFIFESHLVNIKIDLKLFIETQEDIKLQRRIKRDTTERGMTEEEVHYQWEKYVIPSYKKHLIPQKKLADILIANDRDFETGLNLVFEKLNPKIVSKTRI